MASEISFSVLPSKFNEENYLRIKSGYSQISINPRAWSKIIKTSKAVTEMLNQPQQPKDTIILSLNLTEYLAMAVQSMNGVNYVVFHRGDTLVKLNSDQWLQMVESFPNLDAVTVNNSAMAEEMEVEKLEGETTLYTVPGLSQGFLSRDSLSLYCFENALTCIDVIETPFTVKEEPQEIFKCLKAYMIAQKIQEYNEITCQGCNYRRPSQLEHACNEIDWEIKVEDYYAIASKYGEKRLPKVWQGVKAELNINKALTSYFTSEEEVIANIKEAPQATQYDYLFKALFE